MVHTVLAVSPPPPRFLVDAEGRLVQRSANAGLRQGYPDKERGETRGGEEIRRGPAKEDLILGWVGAEGRPVDPRSPTQIFSVFQIFVLFQKPEGSGTGKIWS